MNKRIKKKIAIRKCKEGIKRSVLLFYDLGPEAIDGLELMYTYRMARIKNEGRDLPLPPLRTPILQRRPREVREFIRRCKKQITDGDMSRAGGFSRNRNALQA